MSNETLLHNMKLLWTRILQVHRSRSIVLSAQSLSDLLGNRCARLIFGQSCTQNVNHFKNSVSHVANAIGECFTKQCNGIAVQRLRRASQIVDLYKRLYGEIMMIKFVDRIRGSFLRNKSLFVLLSAAFFSWDDKRVTDEELKGFEDEMVAVQGLVHQPPETRIQDCCEWETVIDKQHLKVWRRPIQDSYTYQYRVYGSFTDIPARAFYNTQVDLSYRKQWDRLTIDIRVVDQDRESDSEVVYWQMKYPYPMYSRDYVYVRRYKVDHQNKMLLITNRAVEHPMCPVNDNFVRVSTYMSTMVIHPHSSFDENGFDYCMTYFDDPQAAFPSPAYNWMARTGVPDFVEKLHKAAQFMHELTVKKQKSSSVPEQESDGTFSYPGSQYA
ncbi:stAR-related lipid transfer protein 7, mitochondrial-like [Gigantopelta aegis]|uniref:stAR-related lipid transfer protein 7, mitochondrial-like n=1 Tax=Gigantopelta aegis TaxID=1735272 RepID=UPI001B88CC81|nr:stAR-related lipid transfer protein 7, mitochondrial-like [Gigantopelta aegis]